MKWPLLASLAGLGCATRPEMLPTPVDSEWIQPQVEATAVAAARCLGGARERVIEVEVSSRGVVGYVHPLPAPPELVRCVAGELVNLRPPPAAQSSRAMASGDGRLIDLASPRGRGLALRARAIEQLAPIEACSRSFQERRPHETARVAVALQVGGDGAIERLEVQPIGFDEAGGGCVGDAVRALRLPAIAGAYRYSYVLAPNAVQVGAADVHPLDPYHLRAATEALAGPIEACTALYRHGGQILLHVQLQNDGGAVAAEIERGAGSLGAIAEERRADECLVGIGKRLRVPFFEGPPQRVTVPLLLR